MINEIVDILLFKYPDGGWNLKGNVLGGFVSKNIKKPTAAQLKTWDAELTAYNAANAYRENRLKEYPPINDQLDAIWKELNYRRLQGDNLVSDADAMLGKVLSIKSKYPKP